MKHAFIIALTLSLGACALPETTVKTGSPRPQLAIKGAPADTILIVDGLAMGPASQYDGNPKVLVVEEGVHQVQIQRSGKTIHTEKAFVSNGETKTITVNAGSQ
jgi:hypothetical protein